MVVNVLSKEIVTLMSELQDEKLLEEVKKEIKKQPPLEIIERIKEGLSKVGDLFERGEYFLSDLIFAADIFKRVNDLLEPHLTKKVKEIRGKVVIGTVEGDFHDIGKNIIISLLKSNGYLVEDLGKDVTPKKFLESIQKFHPDILAMSGLLTASFDPMRKTVELVKKAYKEKIFIILGGSPVTDQWVKEIGADFGTNNAATGIKLINKILIEAKV